MNWKSPWVFMVGIFAMFIELFEYVTYHKTFLVGLLVGSIVLSKNFEENKFPKAATVMRILAVIVGVFIPVILIIMIYPNF